MILGLGLNVNWNPEDRHDVQYLSTSILAELGGPVSRNELLADILNPLEVYLRDVISGSIEGLYKRWNELSLVMGKEIRIISNNETIYGTALRIDYQGALILKKTNGEEQKILNGDVSLRF